MSKPSEVIMNLKRLIETRRASRLAMSAAKAPDAKPIPHVEPEAPAETPSAPDPVAEEPAAEVPVTETAPVEETVPVAETAPAEEVAPVEDAAPVEEVAEKPKKRKSYYKPKKKQV